jgi:hypothetical protein
MLALRMDWTTGRGFASDKQLMADADVSESTVRRATRWGRQAEFTLRTRRGHRIDAERKAASEWQLTQPVSSDLLANPTGQGNGANRSAGRPNRSPETDYQESVVHQDLSPSSDLIKIIIEEIEKATGRTIGPQWAARTARFLLEGRGAANPAGYIRASIRAEPDPKTRFLSLYDNQDQA